MARRQLGLCRSASVRFASGVGPLCSHCGRSFPERVTSTPGIKYPLARVVIGKSLDTG